MEDDKATQVYLVGVTHRNLFLALHCRGILMNIKNRLEK